MIGGWDYKPKASTILFGETWWNLHVEIGFQSPGAPEQQCQYRAGAHREHRPIHQGGTTVVHLNGRFLWIHHGIMCVCVNMYVHIYIYICWCDVIWYDMKWYMIWWDKVWYDMMRYMIYDIWHMIYDIWYLIYDDIWYMIYNTICILEVWILGYAFCHICFCHKCYFGASA